MFKPSSSTQSSHTVVQADRKGKGVSAGQACGRFPGYENLKDELRLAFESPQDEHHRRSAFLALKQSRLSMLDYIQQARHVEPCIVTNLIDTVTKVHVFVTGMNAAHQRFYLRGSSLRRLKRCLRSRCAKTSVPWLRAWSILCLLPLLKRLSHGDWRARYRESRRQSSFYTALREMTSQPTIFRMSFTTK
ncbi:unnamed protein product [Peronospora belbahrii]|uniref:Retrotransposon gag domain-containing protein n=1 Tax=Peronospora belbahrii TaxID=622444 RepID=A0AAU9L1U0_9STRA|nr:unnamed protein product [Peronospora belbahrii]CAH0517209.1 unnamed protein product [Peronospora belbahrii]